MSNKLRIGVLVVLTDKVDENFGHVTEVGLDNCQLCCWDPTIMTQEIAAKVNAAKQRTGVEVSSFWAGYTGPAEWNFMRGPATIGIVPIEHRARRVQELKIGATFASWIKAPSIATHLGFIPEDPNDKEYPGVVAAVKEVAQHCKSLGLDMLFETGQETPVALLRVIDDVGTGNLGINLDPANLVLYGKANPVDSLEIFGKYVKGMHAKDGLYPTDSRKLGHETRLGDGKVDFNRLVPGLKALGFKGPITIEREISGPEQIADIHHAIKLLTPLL